MKFALFVEGYTEKVAIADFLRRWLDPQLEQRVGISVTRFEGWAHLRKDLATRAYLHLNNPKVIAVISLLDLYGPTFYPADKTTVRERYDWGKQYLEGLVDNDRFFHFFAVHEFESWLLSDPEIFSPAIKRALQPKSNDPESVNNDQPPAKLLDQMYRGNTGRYYKKIVDGKALFGKLDPDIAYEKCPHLKLLLDKMLELAKAAESQ